MKDHPSEGIYIRVLPFFLLGYAVAGRPFAYLGVPPIYIGEVLLMMGAWQMLHSAHLWKVFLQPTAWLLAFFMLWSLSRTAPYLPDYGVMALRDGALWGYGLFAFVIAMILIGRPVLILLLLHRYQFFTRIFPFITLIGLLSLLFFNRVIFEISDFFQMKPGDILVQLAAMSTFYTCNMLGRISPLWTLSVIGSLLVAGSIGRGGLLAFSITLAFITLIRLRHTSTWRTFFSFSTALIVVSILLLSTSQRDENHNRFTRHISPEQLAKNIISIVTPSEQWGLEGTKRYRLEWWDKIINYTFFGDYFIGGKGYGINLAETDDQLIRGDTSLRSPHNVHLTILARSGVPGLCLWVLLNLSWFVSMLRAITQAKFADAGLWEGWLSTLLSFYLAAMINASFDVYLEGPMGGVWFWTVFGIGMASTHLYRTLPQLMMVHDENSHRA